MPHGVNVVDRRTGWYAMACQMDMRPEVGGNVPRKAALISPIATNVLQMCGHLLSESGGIALSPTPGGGCVMVEWVLYQRRELGAQATASATCAGP